MSYRAHRETNSAKNNNVVATADSKNISVKPKLELEGLQENAMVRFLVGRFA